MTTIGFRLMFFLVSLFFNNSLSHIISIRAGTHMTWGLNLGANNLSNAFNMAKSILKAFNSNEVKSKGIVLDFLEIGNE
jgi:hypothetical protein